MHEQSTRTKFELYVFYFQKKVLNTENNEDYNFETFREKYIFKGEHVSSCTLENNYLSTL